MALNIFDIPQKTTINCSLQSKSIMVVGKSKAGKSTICADAPKPIFIMTENGGEMLTGFTPAPVGSWADFKNVVTQLCSPKGRESFDTVVIDTYTNLILLLDKYVGAKLSTDKSSVDFGSDADYGRGTKPMRAELGLQLQRLANQGYLLLNIVHAEEKTDFNTKQTVIGTSLSNQLYGVAEKFVDQIIYLSRSDKPDKDGKFAYKTYFNPKGGFSGAGGRLCPDVDSVDTSFENIEKALLDAMIKQAKGDESVLSKSEKPSVTIEQDSHDFEALKTDFQNLTSILMGNCENQEQMANRIKAIVESELGAGKTVSKMNSTQAELLANILSVMRVEFEETEADYAE